MTHTPITARTGSSPHSRGAPSLLARRDSGKRDHPRIRGEHDVQVVLAKCAAGSSPHSRGAHARVEFQVMPVRIIPAFAGSTPASRWSPSAGRDHPRIRGEHHMADATLGTYWGSSPHSRGARDRALRLLDGRGIIPAFAGSTSTTSSPVASRWDHPRIRGEHAGAVHGVAASRGSSPHSRGALVRFSALPPPARIIPAFAGSTNFTVPFLSATGDHPRIRGEHRTDRIVYSTGTGSSPHSRGALRDHSPDGVVVGIIPAFAGST